MIIKKNITNIPIVNSFNEWDPLEEIIVGRIEGAAVPVLTREFKTFAKPEYWNFFKEYGGKPYPKELLDRGIKALDNLQRVLEDQGIIVKRPEIINFTKPYKTPYFESTGFNTGNVRDFMLVIGDEIIESPMAYRCRYFEFEAYRELIKEYFKKGAKWTTAPKCSMKDALYDQDFPVDDPVESERLILSGRYITTEFEPCFDAADFVKFGKDIIVCRSLVTNRFGIEWMRRHLGPEYRIHIARFQDGSPMHLDTTWVPIGEGRVLSCPTRPCRDQHIIDMFINSGWEIFYPPAGLCPPEIPLHLTSRWLSMNIIMLDQNTVVVEESEKPTIKFLKNLGLKIVPVDIKGFFPFGGGLHCSTCDVRRKGALKSYLNVDEERMSQVQSSIEISNI